MAQHFKIGDIVIIGSSRANYGTGDNENSWAVEIIDINPNHEYQLPYQVQIVHPDGTRSVPFWTHEAAFVEGYSDVEAE